MREPGNVRAYHIGKIRRRRGERGPGKDNPLVEVVMRTCLGCAERFPSQSSGNRLCVHCKIRNARVGRSE